LRYPGVPDQIGGRGLKAESGRSSAGEADQDRREGHEPRAHVTFQMAAVAVPRQMFQEILTLIARLRAPPAPA